MAQGKLRKNQQSNLDFNSSAVQAILKKRAQSLAKATEKNQSENQESVIQFRLGDNEIYGIPYRFVDEIITVDEIAVVPFVPSYVLGVINRRSDVLTVVDVAQFFQIQRDKQTDEQWIIIVRVNDVYVGFLVDEVLGNRWYVVEELSTPIPSSNLEKIEYVKGLIDGKVTLLDVENILTDESLF